MPNADSSVVIEFNADVSEADKELAKLKKNIAELESKINKQEAKKSPLVFQAEALNQQMKEARAEVQRYQQAWAAGVPGADREQSAAEGRLNNMQTQYQKIVEQIDKIDAKLIPAYENLDRMETEAGGLQQQINESTSATQRMAEATAAAGKYMDKFTKRVKGLAKRIFVFTLITRALSSLRTWLWSTIKSNDEAAAAVAKLKGALLTLAQPLLEVIIPAFTALVNILAAVVSKIASFIAMLFGTNYEDASKSAEALYNEQNAISGVGSAAKKASKSLAAFDEINKLSDNSAESGGGGGASTIAPSFETVTLSEGMQNVLTIVEKIGAALLGWGFSRLFMSALENLVGLNISKKVKIGISLVAAGGAEFIDNIVNILNGEYSATSIQSAISSAVSGLMVGAGLVALGASTFMIPVSILISFVLTDLIVNFDSYKKQVGHELDAAKSFLKGDSEGFWSSASDAFLTWLKTDSWGQKLGKAILGEKVWNKAIKYFEEGGGSLDQAFPGVADAVNSIMEKFSSLKETIPAVFTSIKDKVKEIWGTVSGWFSEHVVEPIKTVFTTLKEKIQGVWRTVSGWFSEHVIEPVKKGFQTIKSYVEPIFEGLWIIIQAVWQTVSGWFSEHVVEPLKEMFTKLKETLRTLFTAAKEKILEIWGTVSGWFSEHVVEPIKTVFGAVKEKVESVFTAAKEKIQEIWGTVSAWFEEHVTGPIKEAWETAIESMKTVAKTVFNGIIGFFEKIVNGIISGLNTLISGFNTLVSKAAKVIKVDWDGVPYIPEVKLPRLATGAVIPPNREFMAVLGDQKSGNNIEAPEALIRRIVREESGIGGGNQTVVLEIDGQQFAKVVYQLNRQESRRIGLRLAEV